jgi:penicillin amidase
MLAVQTDVYSGFSHFLAREVASAYARHSASYATLADAVELLRNWNGQMSSGQAAPMIASLTYLHLRTAFARRASQAKQPVWNSAAAPAVIEKLLRERPREWFDDYDKLLLDNLADAVEEGRRMQGRNVAKWDYGAYNGMVLDNPILGRLPVLGKYFNIGRAPMSGSPDTVKLKRLGEAFGPSMRMVVDLSNLDASMQNITLGESGQVLSRHYRDQWDAHLAGRSFPMQFNKIDATDTLVFMPEPR